MTFCRPGARGDDISEKVLAKFFVTFGKILPNSEVQKKRISSCRRKKIARRKIPIEVKVIIFLKKSNLT